MEWMVNIKAIQNDSGLRKRLISETQRRPEQVAKKANQWI